MLIDVNNIEKQITTTLEGALDRRGVGGDIKRAAAIRRVLPNHPPAHRRQRGTLLRCHQFWVDLVAGVRIAVHDDEVSQFLLLRVRQAVPGKPGRGELRLAAILRDDPR
jgi:hypothetical protein